MDRSSRQDTGPRGLALLELVLLGAVVAEVAIGRLLVRGIEAKPVYIKGQAQKIVPPTWFVALDYVALFLLYFVALIGVIVLVQRARKLSIDAATSAAMAAVGAFAVIADPDVVGTFLHLALLGVAVHQIVRVWMARGDLGAAIGITVVAAPILVYCSASLLAGQLWTEEQMLGGEAKASIGKLARNALVIAAIASPYCLSPRPFARSMTRVLPFVVALLIAGAGAVALRLDYPSTVKAVNRVLGLDLRVDAPQDQIALYLLAFATITWTTVACMTAPSPARRRLGFGLALLVLAGHGFAWPASFLTAAVGLSLIADGAVRVREEERSAFVPVTPAIDDETWQGFVQHVVAALRKLTGDDGAVSAVSVRGEGEHTSTVVVTERHGVPVRLRIERMARAVVVIDVVCGREVDAGRPATWTLVSRTTHPEPPSAGPVVRADDAPFDERFRCRGDRDSLLALMDDGVRARAAASLDGWLAYWKGQSLRHRVFPGQGAPMDVPIPLSQLALDRRATPESAERLVRVLELCAEIARPGLATADEPVALAEAP
jgi:hypothetical protein